MDISHVPSVGDPIPMFPMFPIPPPIPLIKSKRSMTADFRYQSENETEEIASMPWLDQMVYNLKLNRIPLTSLPTHSPTAGKVSNEIITRILHQFDRYDDYESYSNVLLHGFARDSEKDLSSIIPSDITSVCLTYYYQKESKYIQLSYKLYQILKSKELDRVSGEALISVISENNLLQNTFTNTDDIKDICSDLVRFGLIELLLYQTTFSSLFDQTKKETALFNESADYVYGITEHSLKAFEEHSQLN